MPKLSDGEELVGYYVRLERSTLEKLKGMGLGNQKLMAKTIRTILRAFVNQSEERIRKVIDETERG